MAKEVSDTCRDRQPQLESEDPLSLMSLEKSLQLIASHEA